MLIDREKQAVDEMANTTGSPWVLWTLTYGFLLLLVIPTATHLATSSATLIRTGIAIPKALTGLPTGPFDASHDTLQAIDAFEAELRNGSPLAQKLRPATQTALFRTLGVGNAQVIAGTDLPVSPRVGRRLYFRPAVQHVMGPPFLSQARLKKRRREGNAWTAAIEPDPRPAVRHFAEDLRRRGVELMVLPIPVKASVDGTALRVPKALRNPSWDPFLASLDRLGAGGPNVLDLLRKRKGAQFLETDTHWRPEAMDAVAQIVAASLKKRGVKTGRRLRRTAPVEVQATGDLADLLGVWPGTIALDTVQVPTLGSPPDRSKATVLVLGDSFAGIYEDPSLGFGDHGGFADALAHHLGQPVDAIVVNAGGAWQTRQALADQADRLDDIDVVVWLFTGRELSLGDWRDVRLPETDAVVDPRWVRVPDGEAGLPIRGTVTAIAPTANPLSSTYPDQVVALSVAIEGVPKGAPGSVAWLMAWGLEDRIQQRASELAVGDQISVGATAFGDAPRAALTAGRSELPSRPTAVPLLWVNQWESP